ncbi:MAG: M23 family metallopeptidase [Bacillaceae bacterium]|nr:M23 family metallopeptidase [Bacillaceae bacterium]
MLVFQKRSKLKKVVTDLENILSVENTVKQINLGTLEEDKYIVEQGDVLGSIALDHGISTKELLELNPSINEDTLIRIGDELNVTVYEPVVKVVIEEAIKTKEEIPFQTETKEDSNMFKGDTKVEQQGQIGERVVHYSVVRENGRTVKRQIVEEVVTKEPVNRVIVKGTKVVPSRGTGTLAWPAVGGYISSYQGTRWGRFHRGIDIARPTNLNILAADNGTVTFAGWDGGYGNKIIVDHNNGVRTLYAHLASMDVKVGDTVAQGSKIGTMGETGNTTGVHLHFEVYQNGQLKNPMDFLK